jgi:CRP/FNR family transcriptional regulator
VRICQFPRDGFLRLLDIVPGLERKVFEAASNQLDACRDWAMLLRQPQAVQRVAGFLHYMATHAVPALRSKTGAASRARFQLPLARREIADFLGVSKETVSRQMTIMRALSVIDLISRRDVAVRDLDMLAGLAANGTGGDDAGCGRAEVREPGAAVCQGYH